jgi:hypothetical protein
MARELAGPTAALDQIVEQFLRPLFMELLDILAAMLGRANRGRLFRTSYSIVAQCLFYYQHRAVIERLEPGRKYGPRDIDSLVEHVVRFSLGGLAAVAKDGRRPKRTSSSAAANTRKE